MIKEEKVGDITSSEANPYGDIVLAMNRQFRELTPLARKYLGGCINGPAEKGTIVTCKHDDHRRIHFVVIHDLHETGWKDAHKYLRVCLDTLWAQSSQDAVNREFSIVKVGTGPVGVKYNANPMLLRKAMEESYLELTLFKLADETAAAALPIPTTESIITVTCPPKFMTARA